MGHIERSIEIDVTVPTAYGQWARFEEFPRFMGGVKEVKEVRQERGRALQWKAAVGGRRVEWTASITKQELDHVIAWETTCGARHRGSVSFQPVGSDRTCVTLRLDFQPAGVLERTADAFGIVAARVFDDLRRFKMFIEAREHARARSECRRLEIDRFRTFIETNGRSGNGMAKGAAGW